MRVAALRGAQACRTQAPAGICCEASRFDLDRPEFGHVTECPLEVEADQLVGAVLIGLEPAAEALVELCTPCLRERRIRRIADENVLKTEVVLACRLGAALPDQALPDQRQQVRADACSLLIQEQMNDCLA